MLLIRLWWPCQNENCSQCFIWQDSLQTELRDLKYQGATYLSFKIYRASWSINATQQRRLTIPCICNIMKRVWRVGSIRKIFWVGYGLDISDFTAEVIILLEIKSFSSADLWGVVLLLMVISVMDSGAPWSRCLGYFFLAKQCEELANNINAIIVRNVGRTSINCQDTGY